MLNKDSVFIPVTIIYMIKHKGVSLGTGEEKRLSLEMLYKVYLTLAEMPG